MSLHSLRHASPIKQQMARFQSFRLREETDGALDAVAIRGYCRTTDACIKSCIASSLTVEAQMAVSC